ncbi:MAG TPA: YkgJ family cysteine cluster protein [Tepidisphaeraceae bacterium]|jgi:hypothetical protein
MKLDVLSKSPWYADGLSFSCTQCGNCCTGGPGFVWINEEEIQKLAEYLKISVLEVQEKYCRKIGGKVSLKERFNRGFYDCIFLTELPAEKGEGVRQSRRGCGIYPVRPMQCRTWPFWQENLESEKAWDKTGEKCPGMGRGKKYSQAEIEKIRDSE